MGDWFLDDYKSLLGSYSLKVGVALRKRKILLSMSLCPFAIGKMLGHIHCDN